MKLKPLERDATVESIYEADREDWDEMLRGLGDGALTRFGLAVGCESMRRAMEMAFDDRDDDDVIDVEPAEPADTPVSAGEE